MAHVTVVVNYQRLVFVVINIVGTYFQYGAISWFPEWNGALYSAVSSDMSGIFFSSQRMYHLQTFRETVF